MRKIGIILLIFLFCISFFNKSNNEEIRVRVIPNSDEKIDIMEKEVVKEYVIYYLKEAYDSDYDIFVNNIKQTMTEFEVILEKIICKNCSINFTNHTLYNKTYNNSAVKNEETLVLYVVIGKGLGSNWWGTVYPEFLSISSSEEIKYESLIVKMFQKIKGEY